MFVDSVLGCHQTKDPDFDDEVTKFRCVAKTASSLVLNISNIVQGIRIRHLSELELSKGLAATLLEGARTPEMEALHKTAVDSYDKLFQLFVSILRAAL